MHNVTIPLLAMLFGLALAACDDAGDADAPPALAPQQETPPAQQQ